MLIKKNCYSNSGAILLHQWSVTTCNVFMDDKGTTAHRLKTPSLLYKEKNKSGIYQHTQ